MHDSIKKKMQKKRTFVKNFFLPIIALTSISATSFAVAPDFGALPPPPSATSGPATPPPQYSSQQDSQQGSGNWLAEKCVETLNDSGYELSYGNRVDICGSTASRFALDALQSVAKTGKAIEDDELSDLVAMNNPRSVRCVKAFVDNEFDFGYGERSALCRSEVQNEIGILALEKAAKSESTLEDDTVRSLLQTITPGALQCFSTLIDDGYNISYSERVSICGQFVGQPSLAALSAVAATKKSIEDDLLLSLSRINGPHSVRCVSTLAENGYDLSYGERANICRNFSSDAANKALESLSSKGRGIEDDELEALSRL